MVWPAVTGCLSGYLFMGFATREPLEYGKEKLMSVILTYCKISKRLIDSHNKRLHDFTVSYNKRCPGKAGGILIFLERLYIPVYGA